MEKKKDSTEKQSNLAIDSFKQGREKGAIRNRFFAAVVDFIIIGVLYQLAVVLFRAPDIRAYMEMQEIVRGLTKEAPEVIARARLYQQSFGTFLAIGAAYEAILLALFGGSLGKLVFGFRVVLNNEGRSMVLCKLLLALRAVVKALSIYLLSAIPYVFLCLTTFGNAESRSGFDLCAGTRVLYKRRVNK